MCFTYTHTQQQPQQEQQQWKICLVITFVQYEKNLQDFSINESAARATFRRLTKQNKTKSPQQHTFEPITMNKRAQTFISSFRSFKCAHTHTHTTRCYQESNLQLQREKWIKMKWTIICEQIHKLLDQRIIFSFSHLKKMVKI